MKVPHALLIAATLSLAACSNPAPQSSGSQSTQQQAANTSPAQGGSAAQTGTTQTSGQSSATPNSKTLRADIIDTTAKPAHEPIRISVEGQESIEWNFGEEFFVHEIVPDGPGVPKHPFYRKFPNKKARRTIVTGPAREDLFDGLPASVTELNYHAKFKKKDGSVLDPHIIITRSM